MSRPKVRRQGAEQQSASVLVAAITGFLRKHGIPKSLVIAAVNNTYGSASNGRTGAAYKRQLRHYEEMGIVMSTWFNSRTFLDKKCRPIALKTDNSSKSIRALVRASRVSISAEAAADLLRQSESVEFDGVDTYVALRREFVLPNFEVPRAALVVTRYLETLAANSSNRSSQAILLLERNCHVPAVNLGTLGPTLRDIKGRGAAFLNAINGDIEGRRVKGKLPSAAAEMSVHLFAWIRQLRSAKGQKQKNARRRDGHH